jgi:MFS transporter, MHS family, proline/betaine transporter
MSTLHKSNRALFTSVLSSSIGNVLEWNEYTLYAYFATVISALFFPSDNTLVSMILTFATFAVGLAARPIGGLIFGYLGDRFSRKKTLLFTMLLMSVPTLCIGLLPTYDQIGIMAPICLVVLRIIQGVALGGEFGASCVYLYESVQPQRRGFFGCLALTGVGLGLVLSSCTIFLVESFVSKEAIYSYAWRIPFFISVLGALVAFYMRKSLLETEDFVSAKQSCALVANPFMEMLRSHKSTLASLFAIFLTTQVAFFTIFIFGKAMMIEFLHFDARSAGLYNLFTVMSYTVATVVFGYFTDFVNKRYIILFGSACLLLCAYPFIVCLKEGSPSLILLFSLIMGALIGMTESTLNPLVAESFPTNVRATSVSFCWNCTAIAFGGSAPIVSMWLIERFNTTDSVAYFLIAVCSVTVLATSYELLRRNRRGVASVTAPM